MPQTLWLFLKLLLLHWLSQSPVNVAHYLSDCIVSFRPNFIQRDGLRCHTPLAFNTGTSMGLEWLDNARSKSTMRLVGLMPASSVDAAGKQ